MRKISGILTALTVFFIFTFPALADIAADLDTPTTTPQPFSFYCAPYADPFVEGGSYAPTHNGTCHYTLPQTQLFKILAVYRGVIGNATLVNQDATVGLPISSLRTTPNSFGTNNTPGDNFFAVAYSTSTEQGVTDSDTYFRTGVGIPAEDYTSLAFKWAGDELPPADTAAPVIEISNPLNGESYLQSRIDFIATNVTDASPIVNTTYKVNGVVIDGDAAFHFSDYPLGSATLVVAATDSAGNTGYATSTFNIVSPDPVAPEVVINAPAQGSSHLQNEIIFIDATFTDASAIATSTYKLNGVGIDGSAAVPLTSFPLGGALLVVSATDAYGNIGYATSTFTIVSPDLIPPTVTITSPAQGGQYFNTASLFATANVTDASPIVATAYSFNGVEIDQSQPLPLLSAPLGLATVSVSATDAYGNAASTTVTFTLKAPDVTAPTITITNPVAGQTYLNTASVVPLATITDASGVATSTFELNGMLINPAQPLPLNSVAAGTAKMVVTATDVYGNKASTSVSFIIQAPAPTDTQGPVINITNPKANKLYKRNENIKATATITDASPISSTKWYLNDTQFNPAYDIPFNKARMGTSTVKVVATDKFGNVGSASVSFRIGPGIGTCVSDITDAYNNKWIKDKNDFNKAFKSCFDLLKFDHDRNDHDDHDDHEYHGDDNDDRANREIDRSYRDLHDLFNWDKKK
ncbi:hypothetical protein KW798_00975 [Candidatus Parcubacteria bacterium]|nr:hypothetical protein [Candidatus Parcubacteria bacterium]